MIRLLQIVIYFGTNCVLSVLNDSVLGFVQEILMGLDVLQRKLEVRQGLLDKWISLITLFLIALLLIYLSLVL